MSFVTASRPNCFAPRSIGQVLKGLAPLFPVHRDSVDEPIRFTPLSKKKAIRLYHKARDLERQTREAGKQDGVLGRNGLKVLEVLITDFMRFSTGELQPSIASIADKASMCVSSVRRGLDNHRAAGVVDWVRRKASALVDGCILWFQQSNAYHIRPVEQWLGYEPAPSPPAPDPATWGATPPMPSGLQRALEMARQREALPNLFATLEEDPADRLQIALAKLGRAVVEGAKSIVSPDVQIEPESALLFLLRKNLCRN